MSVERTPPIELTGTASHLHPVITVLDEADLDALRATCPVVTDLAERAEASRDWWPLTMHWALAGEAPAVAAVVARPVDVEQVTQLLALCTARGIPVTAAGGRSGVCGAAIPVAGGVLLDTTGLLGPGGSTVRHVDRTSALVEAWAGAFGPDLEDELRDHGLSVGHFPQSFDISTVGGWVACRGAGQYSTRYGKIEDLVVGLEVVLADGTVVRTGGSPAAAAGPALDQLFIGSEGTLGVITAVTLRAHPVPAAEARAAFSLPTFAAGIGACREVLQAGATPAVLRLYDAAESARGQGGDGSECVLLVLDEGHPALVDATMAVVREAVAAAGGREVEAGRVDRWVEHRNDTSALQALTRKGFVVDTMEIAAPWSRLEELFDTTRAALMAVPHARAATCHLSHSYSDGACLYFTFAATPPVEEIEPTYVAMWDAGQRTVLAHGGNLSHHHGVGLNRSRFVAEALGAGHDVLAAVKQALDPQGILNPGKLGLPSRFGEVGWP